MPGGQTSRACDACRKRKKKCDLRQPICGRCQLLKIPCVNCNIQRYKFQHQLVRGSRSTSFSQAVVVRHAYEAPIPQNLDNKNSRIAAQLVSICQISDLSYDVSVYGDFFRFIPRRLGTNQCLDTVVRAFVCAHPTLYTKSPSIDALAAYGVAIKSVANALTDDAQKESPDLLCALHMLNICQGWISKPSDQFFNYYAVMSHLLPKMIAKEWTDPFEYAQLIGSCILVIVSAMYSNKTILNPDILGRFLRRFRIPRPHQSAEQQKLTTFDLHQFLQFPIWIRAPTAHIEDMREAYSRAKSDIKSLVERTDGSESSSKIQGEERSSVKNKNDIERRTMTVKNKDDINWRTVVMEGQPGVNKYRMRALHQVTRSLFLTIAIFLNSILRAVTDPFDQDDVLKTEATALTEQVIDLGSDMLALRPLYSSGIAMTTVVAWGADRTPARRARLEKMMADYRFDSIGKGWFTGGRWWETYLTRLKYRASAAIQSNEGDEADVQAVETLHPDKTFDEVEREIEVTRCTIL